MKLLTDKTADIVIVDDDEDDRLPLNYALRQLLPGVKVLSVSDARDAIAYIGNCDRQPSLLITDLNMSCVNGLELLRHIRQSDTYCTLPVLVLTTSQADEDRKRCYQAGRAQCVSGKAKSPDCHYGIAPPVRSGLVVVKAVLSLVE